MYLPIYLHKFIFDYLSKMPHGKVANFDYVKWQILIAPSDNM
jgi:hypothetical protein